MSCRQCQVAGFGPSNQTCAYCEAPLSPRHEHDHMPVPARHGGTSTVPVCLNCHDLKDRVALLDWDVHAFSEAFGNLNPLAKVYMAKLMAWAHDVRAEETTPGREAVVW